MKSLTPEEIDQVIRQYEPLIHHCLQKAHIYWSANDYQDYQQVASIALVEAAQTCHCHPLSEQPYPFVSYAKRRILWKIRDAQRRNYYRGNHELPTEIIPEQVSEESSLQLEQTWLDQALIEVLKKGLSQEELAFLIILLEEEMTQSEKARQLGISRKSFYYRRNRLGVKVQTILQAVGDTLD